MKRYFFLLLVFLQCVDFCAQENQDDLIQFSGIVVTRDSMSPIPFTTILVKNTARGTTSDYYGYFSFVARPNDTLIFSSVGYRNSEFIVPTELEGNRYSLIHSMLADTIELDVVEVYPWPTPAQFKEAFLALDIPDDDIEIMRKNLDPELLAEKADALPGTASLNFKWQNQQRANQLYYAGQFRPISLFNPIAWAQFIQAWKNGDFKSKK